MAGFGGWTGKVLRVDLSTGRSWTEDTIERYKDYLGGTGIGYKVLWDEVQPGTGPHDPENRLIFAAGPLAGTGVPCSGRTAVTTLWPTCWPKPLVASGNMGGLFAAKLKYAGYDALIIHGRADHPVWLSIVDQRVEIHGRTPAMGARDSTDNRGDLRNHWCAFGRHRHRASGRESGSHVRGNEFRFPRRRGNRFDHGLQEPQGHRGMRQRQRPDRGQPGGVGEADQASPLPHGCEQPSRGSQIPAALGGVPLEPPAAGLAD